MARSFFRPARRRRFRKIICCRSHRLLLRLRSSRSSLSSGTCFTKRLLDCDCRSVGENPEAADAAGVSVSRIRYSGVLLAGMLAGIGGAYLSIGQSSLFTRNMTAGRGFIALAALIFGKWRPVQTLLACLLFGFTEAVSIQMQGVFKLPSGDDIPVQFIQMVPYVLTIVVLAGFIGSSRPPRALGIPYQKEK